MVLSVCSMGSYRGSRFRRIAFPLSLNRFNFTELNSCFWLPLAFLIIVFTGIQACAETIHLSLAYQQGPLTSTGKALEAWAKKVEKETDGKVTIDRFPSATLVNGRDAFRATAKGICDISLVNNVYEARRLGLNNVINCLDLTIPADRGGVQLWDTLWRKFPEMQYEFKEVKVLGHAVSSPSGLHTKSNLVRMPKDVRGLKIAATGSKIRLLALMRASPVGMPANDWYLALDRGILDGVFCPIAVLVDRGIEEVAPYHFNLQIGQSGDSLIINREKWDELPPEVRSLLEKLYPWTNDLIIDANRIARREALEKCRSKGQVLVEASADEVRAWKELASGMAEKWIRKNASRGPSREIYNYARMLAAELE